MSFFLIQHTPTGKAHVYEDPRDELALCYKSFRTYEGKTEGWPQPVVLAGVPMCSTCAKRAMKQCTTCNALQPLANFHRRADTADGYQHHCAECRRAYRIARGKQGVKRVTGGAPTAPLYVRIPEETKERVACYAEARNTSLARSTDALLTLALNLVERELAKRGRSLPQEQVPPRSTP